VHDFDSLSLDWLRAKPGAKWGQNRQALNAWVADMDFPPPPVVNEALRAIVDSGDLGYPAWALEHSPALDAFVARAEHRYGWRTSPDEYRELNDVTQGIQIVLEHHTVPGDGVVVLQPSYPPFLSTVRDGGRRMVPVFGARNPASGTGWVFDWERLEVDLAQMPAKVLLLCHPHNPTGHVFSPAEQQHIVDLAARHDLLIISDEIHADLTYAPHEHRPIALLAPERTVTIHAASKAFNLAGLRYALLHLGPADLRSKVLGVANHLYGEPNLMGQAAAAAAWTAGDQWLEACLAHLDRMRHLAVDLLAEHMPQVVASVPTSTYLLWMDCRELGLGDNPAKEFLRRGVRLSEGPDFGESGLGHGRLNFATSSAVLHEAVARMASAPAR
jgi:cystathionine beta-lyase